MNIQKNISLNINIFLNILFGETNISVSQIFIVNIYTNIYLNIHCEYLYEYSHEIRQGYQGNAPGMDKDVWRSETRLE